MIGQKVDDRPKSRRPTRISDLKDIHWKIGKC